MNMEENIKVLLNAAKQLSKQKQYKEAMAIYQDLEKQLGDLDINLKSKILAGIGDIYRNQLAFQKAVEYFQTALELDASNLFALKGMANAYRGLKDTHQEIFWWNKVIDYAQDDFLILNRLADAYRRVGNNEKAEQFYQKSLEIRPDNKFALMGLGDAYYKNKNYNQALVYWERLVEIYSEFVNILTMVGNIYRLRRDFVNAMKYYQKAYDSDPNNCYVLYGIADTLRGQKRYQEAIPHWEKILKLDPNNAKVYTRLGDAFLQLKDYDKSKQYYNDSWVKFKDRYGYIGLIRIEAINENPDVAMEMIKNTLESYSRDIRVVNLLTDILIYMGKGDQVVDILESYLDISKKSEIFSKLTAKNIRSFEDSMDEMDDEF